MKLQLTLSRLPNSWSNTDFYRQALLLLLIVLTYRGPVTSKIEAQLMGYIGMGNTVYTGNNRYILKDIKIGQYKFELRHPDWFFKVYTTQEDAGESYSGTLTALNLNNQWKDHGTWFGQYTV